MAHPTQVRAALLFVPLFAMISGSAAVAATPGPVAKQPPAAAAKPAAGPALLPQPAPQAGPAEQDHIARYDAAIAPVRDLTVAADDLQQLAAFAGKVGSGDAGALRQIRDQIRDATVAKIADWLRLRSGAGDPAEILAFIKANPTWPELDLLRRRYEEQLFSKGGDSRAIKALFASDPPQSGAGYAALASAFLVEGDEATARTLAIKAWRGFEFGHTMEAGFLDRFGKYLSEADHKWRLDRILAEDSRWTGERAEIAAKARRVVGLLSKPEQTRAEARLAVLLRSANALKLIEAAPASPGPDWGFTLQKIQALRRAKKYEQAWQLLLQVPADPQSVAGLDGWWIERRVNAYEALAAKKPKLAYDLVKAAGPLSVEPAKDQAFLAGWIALRLLRDHRAALQHFEAFRNVADGPLSRSKADYWTARTLEAQGDKAGAQKLYQTAAAQFDTFHAELARRKLANAQAAALLVKMPVAPGADEVARFRNLDSARAAVIVYRAKLAAGVQRAFLAALGRSSQSEAMAAMAAHLALALGDTQSSLRIAKSAAARGFNLIVYSYPVTPFPAYGALRQPPEPAFLLGIARQESEFNTLTLSGAGAKGILQVMTVTAHHVCKDYKISCDLPRLMSDPAYNTMMASAYIADRMAEFGNSYVLGIAGYNAGPGRARQWIKEFGDPRDPNVDPIDWIMRIPFEETREYVQKVLSNIQVYRARLAAQPVPLAISEDLVRARGSVATAAPPAPAASVSRQ